MNKFKFSFKVKELELQVEGTRDDVDTISNSIGQQFKNLIQPAGALGEGQSKSTTEITEEAVLTEVKTVPRKKRSQSNGASAGRTEKAKPIDFKNDPVKYGSPVQTWTTLEKSLWLLYVLQTEVNLSEVNATELAETFNKHFKQQGTIRASNISRDFGNQKAGNKATVGENTTLSPTKWYLTDEGSKYAQRLIQSLKQANK
jgi:hypothetical protein